MRRASQLLVPLLLFTWIALRPTPRATCRRRHRGDDAGHRDAAPPSSGGEVFQHETATIVHGIGASRMLRTLAPRHPPRLRSVATASAMAAPGRPRSSA